MPARPQPRPAVDRRPARRRPGRVRTRARAASGGRRCLVGRVVQSLGPAVGPRDPARRDQESPRRRGIDPATRPDQRGPADRPVGRRLRAVRVVARPTPDARGVRPRRDPRRGRRDRPGRGGGRRRRGLRRRFAPRAAARRPAASLATSAMVRLPRRPRPIPRPDGRTRAQARDPDEDRQGEPERPQAGPGLVGGRSHPVDARDSSPRGDTATHRPTRPRPRQGATRPDQS